MKKEKKDKDFLHKPVYPGGIKAIRKFIKENLAYPAEAKEQGIAGTVHLKYTIDHRGKVIEAKVISGLGHGCDEEAIRLVKLLQFEVAKNRKRRVLFHKKIQIHFRLQKAQKKESPPAPTVNYTYLPQEKTTEEVPKKNSSSGYTYTINW